jgi:hypothetical protein
MGVLQSTLACPEGLLHEHSVADKWWAAHSSAAVAGNLQLTRQVQQKQQMLVCRQIMHT